MAAKNELLQPPTKFSATFEPLIESPNPEHFLLMCDDPGACYSLRHLVNPLTDRGHIVHISAYEQSASLAANKYERGVRLLDNVPLPTDLTVLLAGSHAPDQHLIPELLRLSKDHLLTIKVIEDYPLAAKSLIQCLVAAGMAPSAIIAATVDSASEYSRLQAAESWGVDPSAINHAGNLDFTEIFHFAEAEHLPETHRSLRQRHNISRDHDHVIGYFGAPQGDYEIEGNNLEILTLLATLEAVSNIASGREEEQYHLFIAPHKRNPTGYAEFILNNLQGLPDNLAVKILDSDIESVQAGANMDVVVAINSTILHRFALMVELLSGMYLQGEIPSVVQFLNTKDYPHHIKHDPSPAEAKLVHVASSQAELEKVILHTLTTPRESLVDDHRSLTTILGWDQNPLDKVLELLS